jgi:GT2 family glycosyltransferase
MIINSVPAIIIFGFNRADELRKTIESLLKCYDVDKHEIYVFIDGPRFDADVEKIDEVKNVVRSFEDLVTMNVEFSKLNKGLAKSIIHGVDFVFNKHEMVIVLEDDLLVSPNFLVFMNQALAFYRNQAVVFSITGYSPFLSKIKFKNEDVYFTPRGSSWAWGTWKNRWDIIDWRFRIIANLEIIVLKNGSLQKEG